MARLFTRAELPHFDSTRDTRDRLDLVTENVPVDATRIRADRIIYHPGDTCAKHYHVGSYQVFVMLDGEGSLFTPSGEEPLKPGMMAIVAPEEIHWFENKTAANFSFVEFWAPRATRTEWVVEDDT